MMHFQTWLPPNSILPKALSGSGSVSLQIAKYWDYCSLHTAFPVLASFLVQLNLTHRNTFAVPSFEKQQAQNILLIKYIDQ